MWIYEYLLLVYDLIASVKSNRVHFATAILLPALEIIIGALLALVGFRIMDFYDLRWDVAIKVTLGTVIGSWLLILVCIAVFEL